MTKTGGNRVWNGPMRSNNGGNTQRIRYARDLDEAISIIRKEQKDAKPKPKRPTPQLPKFSWDKEP